MEVVISKRILVAAIACALGLGLSQVSTAATANDIEINSGLPIDNVNVDELTTGDFTSTGDSAVLKDGSITAAWSNGGAVIATTADLGTGSQNGNITVNTTLDFNSYGSPTLTLNALNDIHINADIFDSDAASADSLRLNLNPAGVVNLNATMGESTDTTISGDLNIGAGGTYNLVNSSDSLFVDSITNLGTFNFTAGTLGLQGTNGLTIGTNELLGSSVSVATQTLSVTNVVTIDNGSSLSIDGGSFTAGSVTNNGSFAFNSGRLGLSNSGLTIGNSGLLGNAIVLDATRAMSIEGDVTIDAGASLSIQNGFSINYMRSDLINNGTFQQTDGFLLLINQDVYGDVINDGAGGFGNMTLNGGSMYANSIQNINGGTFDFISGTLLLRTDLTIGNGELLGNNFLATNGKYLNTAGNLTIDSGSTVTVDGGSLRVNAINNNGSFSFISGGLDLTDVTAGLTVGTNGLLGDSVALTATRQLDVAGDVTVDSTATLSVDGGTFEFGNLINNGNFDFNSGRLRVTGANGLDIGVTGALGNTVGLTDTKEIDVINTVTVDDGASLLVTGGTGHAFSADLNNNGTVSVSGGTLNVGASLTNTGTTDVTGGQLIVASSITNDGAGASLTLDGGSLSAESVSSINGGHFNFVSGSLNLTGDLNVGNSGISNNFVIADGQDLDVVGDVTVDAGAFFSVSGNINTYDDHEFSSNLYNNGSVNLTAGKLRVDGEVINDGSGGNGSLNILGGSLFTTSITNNIGGELNLGAGYLGITTLANNSGGSLNMTGGTLNVNTINNDSGSVVLNGGTLFVENLNNTSDGTFDFVSGTLGLNGASGLNIGVNGLLGDSVALSDTKKLIVAGDVTVDAAASLSVSGNNSYNNFQSDLINHGSVNIAGGQISLSNGAVTNDVGTMVLNGGVLTTESITNLNGGSFNFVSGLLSLTNSSLAIETGGLLGDSVELTDTRSLHVSGDATVAAGADLLINGGTNSFSTVIVNNGSVNLDAGSVLVGGIVNDGVDFEGALVLNGGSLIASDIVNLNGGTFNFVSGSLDLTGAGMTVGAGGLLGNQVVLTDTRQLSLGGGLVIDAGASFELNGGSFTTNSIINNGSFAFTSGHLGVSGNAGLTVGTGEMLGDSVTLTAARTLSIGGDLLVDTSGSLVLNGGALTIADITNNGSFDFISGSLELTGAYGLTIGVGGVLGDTVALTSTRHLDVVGDVVIDTGASLDINGGATNRFQGDLANSGDLSISGNVLTGIGGGLNVFGDVVNDGAIVLDGGDLSVQSLSNVNGGTFDFLSGRLFYDSNLIVGAGGLLGSDVVLSETKRYYNYGGTTTVNGGSSLTIGGSGASQGLGSLVNGGSVNINAGAYVSADSIANNGSLTIDGGTLNVYNNVLNSGSFTFNSGNLDVSELTVGSGGLLGSNVVLTSSRNVGASTTVVEAGAALAVTGGNQRLSKVTNKGTVNVTGGTLSAFSGFDNSKHVNISNSGTMVSSNANYVQSAGTTNVDGTLDANNVVILAGNLTGSGVIDGNLLVSGGQFNPGNSPGTMEITGNFVLSENGTLHLEVGSDGVGGFEWDQLIVGGDYDLQGGLIKFSLLDSIDISTFDTEFAMEDFFRTGITGSDVGIDPLLLSVFDGVDLFVYDGGIDSWYSLAFSETGALTSTVSAPPVPVPAAVWLFGSGLIGLIGMARRKAA